MKKSIAKNYIYNLIYQMLTILLPLITTPYLSRVLGSENIGIYGYTFSIVTYFVLFGSLGLSMYGQREIAYNMNNKTNRSKVFWEIIIVRCITILLSILVFYFTFARIGDYSLYYKILIIQLIATAFDISWLFQGIEEFDKTVIRNLIIKSLSLILIFTVVNNKNDLWKYFLIYVGSELIGNVSLWFYIPKYISKINIKKLNLKKHIKPALALFLPQVAIQIYTVLDKTMIGLITENMSEVGFYEQAQKIVKSALLILSALQLVMNSRIANAYAENNKKEIKECLEKSFNFVWFISIPMVFGLSALAPKLVPWFYGEGFDGVTNIIIATVPIILAIGLNGITGVQYLVQIKKQNIFTLSVVIGAIVNFILNIILIRYFGGMGAAIASVTAETVIFLVQLKYFKEMFSLKEILKLSIKCFISGIIMFVVLFICVYYMPISIINSFIQVILGGFIYLLVLYLLNYRFLKDLISQGMSIIYNFGKGGRK